MCDFSWDGVNVFPLLLQRFLLLRPGEIIWSAFFLKDKEKMLIWLLSHWLKLRILWWGGGLWGSGLPLPALLPSSSHRSPPKSWPPALLVLQVLNKKLPALSPTTQVDTSRAPKWGDFQPGLFLFPKWQFFLHSAFGPKRKTWHPQRLEGTVLISERWTEEVARILESATF